ncbi:MAG: ABC transporter substrate-binding protein [Candidatus Tectomicrobia bacterium]|nr:ABC transporter substrate-binding protein [Candidatus Tectomicrobia bacterium]
MRWPTWSWKALIGVGVSLLSLSVPARAERVAVMMDWILNGKHSPFFAGVKQGFYKAEGLDAEILGGKGSGNTVKEVGAGKIDYGFADASALIVGRAQGLHTKLLSVIHDKSPHAIFSLRKNGLKKPTDFRGKKFGGFEADVVRIIFPAFAQANGFQGSDVEWISMPPAAKVPSLLSGRVDAITNFVTDAPAIVASGQKVNLEISIMRMADHGVDLYSNGLLAADGRVQTNKDQAGRFVRASMKAWAWAVEHPKETIDIFSAQTPTLARAIAEKQLAVAIDLLLSDHSKTYGIGHIDEEKMRKTIEVLAKYMKLPRTPSTSEVYTNQFLPKLIPRQR